MRIEHLSLTNFRNYTRLELDFPGHTILLQGDNAQGKTNLLEAIYYLATTRSPYAGAEHELVNWLAENQDLPHARLVAQVRKGDSLLRVEITLLKTQPPRLSPSALSPSTPLRTGLGTKGETKAPRYRKHIKVNGVNKRALDLIGQVNVVLFLPEDIDLVSGSPSGRRRYLDATLCQIDPRYCRTLQKYNRVLSQRNHLLRTLREREGDLDQLLFWDRSLVENGAYLVARRQEVVGELDRLAQAIHLELTGQKERLRLRYEPSFNPSWPPPPDYQLPLELDPSSEPGIPQLETNLDQVTEAFRAQLREIRKREILQGMTLIGPHRDDMRFSVGGVDLTIYGSRGQQRTAALTLRLAEVKLIAQEVGEQPILLLDDVMSELDDARRGYLMRMIDGAQQAILTTTDLRAYSAEFLAEVTLLRVKEGRIEEIVSESASRRVGE
ncbi:MAG TPA: DNA replication/repair protein RecF [Anaerolineae bacterium]|nr:DNA replication/repair protein RecF [Anaerolineae bacterium]